MKKIVVLLLVVLMLFTFIGCQQATQIEESASEETTSEETATEETATEETATEETDEQTPDSEESTETSDEIELSADGKYPAETIKIGFVNYDTTAEQVLMIQEYFEYLQQDLNFEIIWSESLASAEDEFEFIEQCAAADCKGIIGYYNEGKEESQKLAASLGMYYWGSLGNETETYEAVKDDEMYVGSYTFGDNSYYDMGYSIAEMLVANDCHKIIVMSGGKDYGVQMFIDRYNGIIDGIDDAKASGYDIEVVYEVPGWPGTEEFTAHQTAALETDADGLAGTLSSLMWIQPMQTAEKFGQIKVVCIDTASDTTVEMMYAGMYVGICAEPASVFGLAVPMIINAATGYGEQQRNEDGSAAFVTAKSLLIDNVEDASYYVEIEKEGGTWIWDIDDVKSVIGAFNPDFTLEDMNALYSAVSVEEVTARKAD